MQLQQRESYLSRNNTNCLKGILAICILVCHLWGNVASSVSLGLVGRVMGVIFTAFGYLSVAIFLFLSGYGLMVQYQKQGKDYLNGFLVKRVLPLYLLCVILILFYWGVRILLGESVAPIDVVQSFFFGETVISKGWYLQSILLWYLLFFVSFRCFSKENQKIAALLVSFVLYVALCLVMKLPTTWYEGAFCLPLGVLWAKAQKKIDSHLNRRYLVYLLVAWGFFVLSFSFGNFELLPVVPRVIVKSLSAVVFVIAVVLLLRILPIENIVTKFLGGMYLEIYVMHGFVLMLWHSKYIYLNHPLLYSIVVIFSALLLARAVRPVFQKILQLGKRKKL